MLDNVRTTLQWKGWLTDFNDMSTRQGLFYTQRTENCVYRIFIFTFKKKVFLFLHTVLSNTNNSYTDLIL